jgi:hypothetical protein
MTIQNNVVLRSRIMRKEYMKIMKLYNFVTTTKKIFIISTKERGLNMNEDMT